MKKTVIFTVAAGIAAAVLRVLQYNYIIGTDGGYDTVGIMEQILRHSVSALLIAVLIVAAVIYFGGRKKDLADKSAAIGGKLCALPLILLSMFTVLEGGIHFGRWFSSNKFDLLAPLGVLAGIYFAVAAFEVIADKLSIASKIFGLFPALFFGARAIFTFFETISVATRSRTKLMMLELCIAALYLMAVTAARASASVAVRRLRALSVICFVFCAVGVAECAYFFRIDLQQNTEILIQLLLPLELAALLLLSFITLIRAYSIAPRPEPQPEPEPETEPEPEKEGLDVYIDDIPEDKDE